MIIQIAYEIDQLQGMDRSNLSRDLSEILRAHRLGHHLVIIKRMVVDWLSEQIELAAPLQATLLQIGRDYTQTADLIRRAHVVLRLKPTTQNAPQRDGKFIDISIAQASRPYTLDRTMIVFEDMHTDGKIYHAILNGARNLAGAPLLNWEASHGGGERTITVAEEKANERRIVCVVIDTDRDAPSERPVPKIERVERIATETSWPLLFGMHPSCREVENLVPYEIVSQLASATPVSSTLKALDKIRHHESRSKCPAHDAFWLYFDLKEGFKEEIFEKLKDPEALAWLSRKVAVLQGKRGIGDHRGFGKNVIDQVLSDEKSMRELIRHLGADSWWGAFGSYISKLMWICAAAPRQYT